MKTKIIVLSLIGLFCSVQSAFAQSEPKDFNFSTIQFGVGSYNFMGTVLKNNENFADDGIFIGPSLFNGLHSGPAFFLSYQRYGPKKSIWTGQISFANLPSSSQFLENTTFEAEVDPGVPILDLADIEEVGSLNHTNFGLSVGHLWRILGSYKKRGLINLGPTFGSNFSKQNYYFFDQSTKEVSSTEKKIVDLSLKVAIELTWRFYSNFGIGLQYDYPVLKKHFVTTNAFNLDEDNPLSKDYFSRPYETATARVKLTYFIVDPAKQ